MIDMIEKTRKSSEQRRYEMAMAALRIIDEQGVKALSTATLVKAMGLSPGAPFKHFTSWRDIYGEMATVGIALIEETFPQDEPAGVKQLLSLMKNRINALHATPGLTWLLRSEQAYLTLPAESVIALQEMAKRSKGYLLAAIKNGVASGEIRNDIAPKELLIIVTGTIHALSGMPALGKKKKQSPDKVLKAINLLLTVKT